MTALYLRYVWPKNQRKIMVLCHIVRNRPQTHFLSKKNKNQHPILNPCAKFELNWLRNKKLRKNLIFDGTSGLNSVLKLDMTSYSDNAYDITNFFVVLKSFWPILYSYQLSLLSDTKWQS